MQLSLKNTFKTYAFMMSFALMLNAEQGENRENFEEERVKITRPLTLLEELEIEDSRYQEELEHAEDRLRDENRLDNSHPLAQMQMNANAAGSLNKFDAKYFHQDQNIFYGAKHIIHKTWTDGSIVEIEDHSLWKFSSYDTHVTRNWMASDLVYIYPNSKFFSSHKYELYNATLEQLVSASLVYGPNLINVRQTDIFDTSTRRIYLTDGSSWEISGTDFSLTDMWLSDEAIIIGLNNRWDSHSYPYILIHPNTNTWVRARLIY
ncbi:MAG: hypothetical protein Tsb0021_06590 [Chlamydiales bacterium]